MESKEPHWHATSVQKHILNYRHFHRQTTEMTSWSPSWTICAAWRMKAFKKTSKGIEWLRQYSLMATTASFQPLSYIPSGTSPILWISSFFALASDWWSSAQDPAVIKAIKMKCTNKPNTNKVHWLRIQLMGRHSYCIILKVLFSGWRSLRKSNMQNVHLAKVARKAALVQVFKASFSI